MKSQQNSNELVTIPGVGSSNPSSKVINITTTTTTSSGSNSVQLKNIHTSPNSMIQARFLPHENSMNSFYLHEALEEFSQLENISVHLNDEVSVPPEIEDGV